MNATYGNMKRQTGFDTARDMSARCPPRSRRSWLIFYFVGEAIHHLLGGKSGDGKTADRL